MLLSYFTEQPMHLYPEDEARIGHPDDHPARSAGDTNLIFSNKFFDAEQGAKLYSDVIEQYELAEEVGFDGIMTNEHHNSVFCMQARCNIMSAFVAARTKRVKIVQLGNPLPLAENPIQIAEEIAMIDMLSKGRLVSGIVRGGGNEQLANNVNPAFNRERFEEAHELLIKTWTEPGPFRWEGNHYQVRVVNPWVLPLQKPHPRIFVPGVTSKETIEFAARHGYPYICLSTTEEQTKAIWGLYDRVAAQAGFTAGPEHRGYLMRVHVQDTREKAIENANQYMWMRGEFTGVGHPVWSLPTGYSTWEARQARLKNTAIQRDTLESQMKIGTIIAGTPDDVIKKIRWWLEKTGPSMLMFWSNDGHINQQDAMRCVELIGKEVLPAVREMGKELGLESPFDMNAPISLREAQKQVAATA